MTASLFIVGAGSARAADLPNLKEAPPVVPVPAFTWTGFYVGVNGGFGLDHFAFPYYLDLPGGMEQGNGGITSSGPVFGGQIGFNYQLEDLPLIGHAVIGIEADDDWGAVTGSNTVLTRANGPATFATRFDNFGTLRLRVGYNFDRLLIYLTGGLTYGSAVSSYSVDGFWGSKRTTHTGFPFNVDADGIGAEYAFTNNWSVKAEYIYDCILDHEDIFTPPGASISFATRTMYHIARVGLNYKFDWFAPPAVAQ